MTLEQRAAYLYPGHTRYQSAWLKMVRLLGDKWLLANSQKRNLQ